MNDLLEFISLDPIYRKYHLGELTFSMVYAFAENFILVLSHDEVVHGKCSMLSKMPGDYWQKFIVCIVLLVSISSFSFASDFDNIQEVKKLIGVELKNFAINNNIPLKNENGENLNEIVIIKNKD